MNFESLRMFLNKKKTADKFASEIYLEVEEFQKKSKVKGSSRPVYLFGGREKTDIGRNEVLTICDAFLKGDIGKWHVYYICDALLMSELVTFYDETIKDTISSMTDPEINGEINCEVIMQIKKKLLLER